MLERVAGTMTGLMTILNVARLVLPQVRFMIDAVIIQ